MYQVDLKPIRSISTLQDIARQEESTPDRNTE